MRPNRKTMRFIAQTLQIIQHGVTGLHLEFLLAWQIKPFPARVSIGALRDTDQGYVVDPQILHDIHNGIQLADAPIDQDQVGPLAFLGRGLP